MILAGARAGGLAAAITLVFVLVAGEASAVPADARPLHPFAWGFNDAGQLGDRSTAQSDRPVRVGSLRSSVVGVAAGDEHSVALTAAGAVWTWGRNDSGQLGIGSSSGPSTCRGVACSRVPVSVRLPKGAAIVAVAAGGEDTLALTAAGAVYAWGDDGSGQLGIGSSTGPDLCGSEPCATAPVRVHLPAGVRVAAVATGGSTALALTTTGAVLAWGDNALGQLGIGSATGPSTCANGDACSDVPLRVHVRGRSVAAVSSGGSHEVALTTGGRVLAWGNNASGQLGVDSKRGPDSCPGPTPVPCSVSPTSVRLAPRTRIVTVAAGFLNSLAVTTRGAVLSWGDNTAGQLGIGTNHGPSRCEGLPCAIVPVPVRLPSAVRAVAVASGGYDELALTGAGAIMAWGDNGYGELGVGTSSGPQKCVIDGLYDYCSKTPIPVVGPGGSGLLTAVSMIAAGGEHNLAVRSWDPDIDDFVRHRRGGILTLPVA